MRAEIAAMPDGVYRGEGHFFDPIEKGRIHTVRVTIPSTATSIDPRLHRHRPADGHLLQLALRLERGGAATVLFMLVDPEMPRNEGCCGRSTSSSRRAAC